MKPRILTAAVAAILIGGSLGAQDMDFERAKALYENGMYSQARTVFESLPSSPETQGYAVLCAICQDARDYEILMDNYMEAYPWSGLIPMMNWRHGLNLFDRGRYDKAVEAFSSLTERDVPQKEKAEFIFKSAYADFQTGDDDGALHGFSIIEGMPLSDYTGPARYTTGYIYYGREKFKEAVPWFTKAGEDPRFTEISNYYVMECRFLEGDYDYVVQHGAEMYGKVPEDRQQHLARIISEAYLVKGDTSMAKKYYDAISEVDSQDRGDLFYAGSLLYAVGDWAGAIDKYSRMPQRTDSLGQAANYNMAYCYIKERDKVSAMQAFKDAASVSFNPDIREDAYFNYAKLSFDLNGDGSVFDKYLDEYSDKKRGATVYNYMALAALHNHDYAAAVAAYDNIDDLDPDMRVNYMKANYLRANQLIGNSSWRSAVPCLKAAAYYSDKHDSFNQMSRYWLAESYFRDDLYTQARALYTELYNISALEGLPEGGYLPYNIAWCYFKENNFEMASKWFDEYLDGGDKTWRQDAMIRKADCYFIRKSYPAAISAYQQAVASYPTVEDLYPYYQAGMAYGLSGNQQRKREMLSNVNRAVPETPFYSETLYELGRSYLDAHQDAVAAVSFEKLVSTSKDSSFVARGLIGLGTVARNAGEYEKSLEYYKRVVSSMPGTSWSADALLAIEAIYQNRQEPEKYLAYLDSIGAGAATTEQDKEEMLFNSAEQVYLAENWQKALVSLQTYAERYPGGKYTSNCNFYMAECYRNLGRPDQACDLYKKVIQDGQGSFVELSAANYAKLSYGMERWADAFEGYSDLHKVARIESNKLLALQGMMRSAYKGKNYPEAIKYASLVSSEKGAGEADLREASYLKAKSLMGSGDRDAALEIMDTLADSPATPEGAEAAYLLIQDAFDRGRFKDVETEVYSLAESATPQTYWLAKSFIVLGDSFVENGDFRQARATFESIRDGYTASSQQDDVPEEVAIRLAKLTQMGK